MEKENKNFVIREVNGGMFVSEERLLTEDVREAMAWKSEGVAMYYLSRASVRKPTISIIG